MVKFFSDYKKLLNIECFFARRTRILTIIDLKNTLVL